ncbi:MAG TPA: hypothetical protein VFK41_06835 [Nocardioidaceae bacterium]|nr:hypothetical protein [Nocardioidaceae bacterium]
MTFAESLKSRRAFLAFIAAVAVAVALATGLFDTDHDASATTTHSHAADKTPAVKNAKQAAFQDDMRKLWEDHVTWTRLAIVTFADASASFDASAARLMKNQEDIGDAIKPFYGNAAGDQLTTLLKGHIGIAVELLQAAKAGNQQAFDKANAAWYANSNEIADFLASANPKYWPQATMRAAMTMHLDQTLAEASHELSGDYAASVADYDEIHHHILDMADVLSTGIIRAFPNKFH